MESRGAYALRGSGPPRIAHEKDDRKANMTASSKRMMKTMKGKANLWIPAKYNIDPMGVTGKEGRSLNSSIE